MSRLRAWRFLSVLLALMLVLGMGAHVLLPVHVLAADPVVNFPDANLQAAIRLAISKPTGDIHASDLLGLTTLNAPSKGIINLTGLEYCSNLSSLYLIYNKISNLSPLAGLTNLTVIELHGNQISDPTPLAGLTNITELCLSANQISNLSPMAGLTNLRELQMYGNKISDLTPLTGLTNLTMIYIDSNQISDITPLTGLTKLRDLELNFNYISDITPLINNTGFATGDFVYLNGNPLNCTSISDQIPTLQARGVTVHWSWSGDCYPKGLDVSSGSYNPADNWTKVRDAGYKFVFVKATSGDQRPDPKTNAPLYNPYFETQIQSAHCVGILTGAYHFAYPDVYKPYPQQNHANDEANYFISKAGDYLKIGYFRPALDIEDEGVGTTIDQLTEGQKQALANWIDTWMIAVYNETGVKPILYIKAAYINDAILGPHLKAKKYDIWLPYWHCETSCDTSVPPLECPLQFWQYYTTDPKQKTCCDKANTINGLLNNIFDLDLFGGSEFDLNKFVISSSPGSPATVYGPAGNVTFSSNNGTITKATTPSADTIPTPPAGFNFPYGLFAFNIAPVTPGSTVAVHITLPSIPQPYLQYWKYQPNSACPHWYQIPITGYIGNDVIVNLTDGALGDADGLVNGIIIDPGGVASAPTVTTDNATSVMATTAILHGNLISNDDAGTTVAIFSGPSDGSWTRSDNLSNVAVGPFSLGVTGLIPNTTYVYRCYAENATSGSWASSSAFFTTQANLGLWRNYWEGPGKDWFWFSSGGP